MLRTHHRARLRQAADPGWPSVIPGCEGGADEIAWLAERWRTELLLTDSTVARMGEVLDQFVAALRTRSGDSVVGATPQDVAAFVRGPTRRRSTPALHTLHLRRTVLRTTYRTINAAGIPVDDPTAGLVLPPKTTRVARPVDDNELALIRLAAHTTGRTQALAAATVALAEACASTGEIPLVRATDLDLVAATVRLPGIGRIRPRTGLLTGWGVQALTRWTGAAAHPRASLVHAALSAPGTQPAQAVIVTRIRHVLDAAGLGGEADVKPNSIRLWGAASVVANGGTIEAAAMALGLRGLDATAAAIGWDRTTP